MKVVLVTRREDLPSLADRWDQLAANDLRDGFFRTYGWYRAWMEHIRPDAQPFVVVVYDSRGVITGLAPLCRLSYRDLGFRLTSVSWAGREVVSGDFLDLICESESRSEMTSAVLQRLWGASAEWSLLVMGEVIEGGVFYSALEKLAEQHRLPLHRQEERICPYIALPESFEKYLDRLSSSTRYHIRRRMRETEKKGAQIELYSGPNEIASRVDLLVRLHLKRWNKDGLPGTLARPGFAAFLRQVCNYPPRGSSSRLYLLSHEGSPVGALLMFYFGESALYYQAGWDPNSPLAALSPGVVLMAHSIRDAVRNGFRFYEFLRGDEDYKSHWTDTYRRTVTVLIAERFLGREYLRAVRLKDKVKSHFVTEQPSYAAT